MSLITLDIQKSINATNLEVDQLNFLADTLTGSNPKWESTEGDGSGAWGVSQKWHGIVTPRDSVLLQAAQALQILRGLTAQLGTVDDWPGPVCYYSVVLKLWWRPGNIALVEEYRTVHGEFPTAQALGWSDFEAKSWIGVTARVARAASNNWIWVVASALGISLAIWLLTRSKK